MATVFLETTTPGAWLVPADWNANSNSIECIGGGAGGTPHTGSSDGGNGGGGGGYSKKSNLNLAPGEWISFQVGLGGVSATAGGDTWVISTADLLAKGGGINSGAGGGVGGQAADGVGDVKYSGGNGIVGFLVTGAPAGGAAGPNGNGGDGVSDPPNNGGTADGGTVPGGSGVGAGQPGNPAQAGISGTEFDANHGCGSGAARSKSGGGKRGGRYGGGGSGGSGGDGTPESIGGFGGQGLIVITWTPNDPITDSIIKAIP